jgi:TetR/AcrR family transcriptional regulator, transcriptional repressor of aconitase
MFVFLYDDTMPKVTQQYRAAQRERILNAARHCFLRDGFHATSIHTVLAVAGVSAGTFYRYFASKDDIILAIAEENLRDVVAPTLIPTSGAEIASLAESVRTRHEADGAAGIAVLVWAEAVHNPVLAERFARLLPTTSVDALVSIVPGYVLLLALLGPAAVDGVPDAIRALWQSEPREAVKCRRIRSVGEPLADEVG